MAGSCAFAIQRVLREFLFAELEQEWSLDPPCRSGGLLVVLKVQSKRGLQCGFLLQHAPAWESIPAGFECPEWQDARCATSAKEQCAC